MSRSGQTGRQQSASLTFDVLAIPLGHPARVEIRHASLQFVLEFGELELAELLARPQRFERFAHQLFFTGEPTGFDRFFDEFLQIGWKLECDSHAPWIAPVAGVSQSIEPTSMRARGQCGELGAGFNS